MASGREKRVGGGGLVKDLLPEVLGKYRLRRKMAVYRIFSRWEEIVGPQLAAKCQPLFIRQGTLHIRVVNHAWIHQLYFFQDKIIDRFNELSGGRPAVARLHFQLGEIVPEPPPPPVRRRVPFNPELLSAAEKKKLRRDVCRHVHDPELAEILYRLRLKERLRRLARP
ncbi:MAG: DUF721 domain-containing protein [Deltaproteobacteria bacterium]|nr:DUF721 domain-containing protein [Deltaproteobacteria bacterium]